MTQRVYCVRVMSVMLIVAGCVNEPSTPRALVPQPFAPPPGSQSGLSRPPGSEAGPEEPAATFLTFDERVGVGMKSPVVLTIKEEVGINLQYLVFFQSGGGFGVQTKSDGKLAVGTTVVLDVAQHPVGLLTALGSPPPKKGEWRGVRGQMEITPLSETAVRIKFTDILLDNQMEGDAHKTRTVPSGEITGRFERSCSFRVIDESVPPSLIDGKPFIAYKWVGDPDWSSPFCQQYRR